MFKIDSFKWLKHLHSFYTMARFNRYIPMMFNLQQSQPKIHTLLDDFYHFQKIKHPLSLKIRYYVSDQSQLKARLSALLDEANRLYSKRQFTEARKLFQQSLILSQNLLTKNIGIIYSIGMTYFHEAKYQQSKQFHLKCLQILNKIPDDTNLQKAMVKAAIGKTLFAQNKFQQAKVYLFESSQYLLSINNLSAELIEVLYVYGCILKEEKKYLESIKYLQKTLQLMDMNYGKQCKEGLMVLNILVLLYRDLKKGEEYELTFKKIINILQKTKQIDGEQQYYNHLIVLLQFYLQTSKIVENRQIVQKCLVLGEKLKKSSLQINELIKVLALIHYQSKQFQKALQYINRCLMYLQEYDNKNSNERQQLLSRQGYCYKSLGKIQDAIKSYQKLLASLRSNPSTQINYITAYEFLLLVLGNCYIQLGNARKCLQFYIEAFQSKQKSIEKDYALLYNIAKRIEGIYIFLNDEKAKQYGLISQKYKEKTQ